MKNYGIIRLRIEELLIEKNISKNKICKDLDIPRTNFNRYCRGEYQRLDTNLLCKLLVYFDCSPNDLIEHIKDGHVKDRRVKDK
ncbi:MAG: helix-turn-helix transcriptional regulator [Eubacteriales bacterium]|nr:helix-turn-helix transcriptional regulator [Eubacteriales bacterium]